MSPIDNDAAVRDRAYILWELAGRPMGREHEFWAQASHEIEGAPNGGAGAGGVDAGEPRVKVGAEDEDREGSADEPSAAELDKLKSAGVDQL